VGRSLLAESFDVRAAVPGGEVFQYQQAGLQDLASPFPRSMAKIRLAFYCALCLIDAFIILATAYMVRPIEASFDPGLAIAEILFFGATSIHTRCLCLDTIRHPREGAARTALSLAIANLATFALATLLHTDSIGVEALARQTAYAMLALYLARGFAVAIFETITGGNVINELILVDGQSSQDFAGRAKVFAGQVGLDPEAPTPEFLNRLGHLLKDCDRVVVDASAERRQLWLEALRGIDIDVEFVAPEFFSHQPLELRSINGHQTLLMRQVALTPAMRFRKRLLDICIASTALMLVSPIMLLLAFLTATTSPGPVLFKQWRVGRGNRQFLVFKFRTMYHGAVDHLGVKSPLHSGDGVTPLGRFMRGTSLDELPQLLNVLRGEMSIVGPRPHALASRAGEQLFWKIDARYWDRHAIKPGMTGLAQVRGLRGPTPETSDLMQRLISDNEYIANWSLLSDIFIMLRTMRVLVHRNAR
jgi:polysaccharide biosynthesis protein PslA